MNALDPVVLQELPVIKKIIADETWLEGERRGGYVSSDDPVVREKVCEVVLRVGQRLRDVFQRGHEEQRGEGAVVSRAEAA